MKRGRYEHKGAVAREVRSPDGAGGTLVEYADLDPPIWWCAIEPATAQNTERIVGSTIVGEATHVLYGDFHAQLTKDCRILIPDPPNADRQFDVLAVVRDHEQRVSMTVVCSEYLNVRPDAGGLH